MVVKFFILWEFALTQAKPQTANLSFSPQVLATGPSRTAVASRCRFKRIRHIGSKLVSYPSGSKAFWTLAKAVENSFCRTSLPPLLKPNGSLAHSAKEKADLFASLFAKNSHLDASQLSPPSLPHCGYHMPEIRIKQKEVLKLLRNLDVDKASGPDGIPALVLRNCAPELSPILTRLYRLSYSTGVVPESWKIANVQPIPKKGSRADPTNYRPISITSILGKVMERLLNKNLMLYLEGNDLLSDHQYGFRRNRSTGDLLVHMTHTIGQAIDGQGEALAVSLDISKAFDRVWHESLLRKLPSFGICPDLCTWISNFLRNRSFQVTVEGCSSDIHLVNAGVPQGSVLSATLFLLHINDLFGPAAVWRPAERSGLGSPVSQRLWCGVGDRKQDMNGENLAVASR
ncbi:unnamed protein product [Colias eurytheme]|nr:unnamed protein product [Colias eurytheme]